MGNDGEVRLGKDEDAQVADFGAELSARSRPGANGEAGRYRHRGVARLLQTGLTSTVVALAMSIASSISLLPG